LFPQFTNHIENGNALLGPDELADQAHGDESARAAHPRTAVHHGDAAFHNVVEKLVYEEMDILFTFLIGDLSVGPVGDLVVRNDFGL
jgi:hypothetical protein